MVNEFWHLKFCCLLSLRQPCLWWMASYCRVGWLFSHLNLPWVADISTSQTPALPLGCKLHIETLSLPEIKIIHFYINVYKITKRINSRYLNKHLPSFVIWVCNSFSSFHEGTWGPVVTWPDQTLWNTNVRHGCQVKRVTALWAGSSRILGQFSLLRYRPHPWKSCSKRPDSISINSRGESRARTFKGSCVNSMWCEKTFSPAHAEESYTSSDCSASPANLVVQWKKEVKKKRIAWSNRNVLHEKKWLWSRLGLTGKSFQLI